MTNTDRVHKIIVEHLGVDAEKVTEQASFIDDLGADSLDLVGLVMEFEEEFEFEIPDDVAETILTVGDAVKYVSAALRTEGRKTMSKPDPMELASQFMGLNAEDFRMFWTIVGFDWNQEDGDIEAQWFYCGQHMRSTEVTVISAMHSAVASGQKSGKDKR